ncbi:hypothetical protein [Candidatus Poriferisodalis sp.]|uniref:hypothetical protein n=1 Tax=Candidatus Poriferisodalis sp. TaxID=3101277 RepID=UPI003B01628B
MQASAQVISAVIKLALISLLGLHLGPRGAICMAMVLEKINNYTRRQRGGFALLYGGLLALVMAAIEPGGVIVRSADRVDFVGRIDAMADLAWLSHLTSILIAIAAVTIIAGLMVVWNTAHEEGLDCTGTRYGLMMAGIGAGIGVLGEGLDMMMVIAIDDGLGAGAAAGSDAVMQVALAMHSVKAGFAFVAIPLVMLGAASMAIGLMPILPRGFHRGAALFTAAVGIVWTTLFWIIAAIVDFEGWDVINGIGGLVAVLWLMLLGRSMVSGSIGAHNNT